MRKRWIVSVLTLSVLLLGACTSFQANRLTIGQALDDLGTQFLSSAKLHDSAFQQKLITKEQYVGFVRFAGYFKTTYESLVTAYAAGSMTPSELRTAIQELNNELTLYALQHVQEKK